MSEHRLLDSADEPYWEISGPRKYLNIPTTVPDHWRVELSFGPFLERQTVVAWGSTEQEARERATDMAIAICRGLAPKSECQCEQEHARGASMPAQAEEPK